MFGDAGYNRHNDTTPRGVIADMFGDKSTGFTSTRDLFAANKAGMIANGPAMQGPSIFKTREQEQTQRPSGISVEGSLKRIHELSGQIKDVPRPNTNNVNNGTGMSTKQIAEANRGNQHVAGALKKEIGNLKDALKENAMNMTARADESPAGIEPQSFDGQDFATSGNDHSLMSTGVSYGLSTVAMNVGLSALGLGAVAPLANTVATIGAGVSFLSGAGPKAPEAKFNMDDANQVGYSLENTWVPGMSMVDKLEAGLKDLENNTSEIDDLLRIRGGKAIEINNTRDLEFAQKAGIRMTYNSGGLMVPGMAA
ncbi:MAG: hypothetical protein H6868_02050 [Rhodospirillales bacterium]|nr:hypothetical protein [Rhodospirillales bacterium]